MRRPPRPYTPEEDATALALDAAGVATRAIARQLDREHTSLERRLNLLRAGMAPSRRVCKCGRGVFNQPWTDFRYCDDCRAMMRGGLGAGVWAV